MAYLHIEVENTAPYGDVAQYIVKVPTVANISWIPIIAKKYLRRDVRIRVYYPGKTSNGSTRFNGPAGVMWRNAKGQICWGADRSYYGIYDPIQHRVVDHYDARRA